jgi:phosphotransferase system  glucose/maltose/N-acetylglucosamine-specific IIC component
MTGVLALLVQNFGLVVFTALAVLLVVYLAYSMARPEKF